MTFDDLIRGEPPFSQLIFLIGLILPSAEKTQAGQKNYAKKMTEPSASLERSQSELAEPPASLGRSQSELAEYQNHQSLAKQAGLIDGTWVVFEDQKIITTAGGETELMEKTIAEYQRLQRRPAKLYTLCVGQPMPSREERVG